MKSLSNNSGKSMHHQLDTSGLLCPEPVMMLHNKIRDMNDNEIVEIIATDPSTERDIPKFCQFLGHELISQVSFKNSYSYTLRKISSKG